MAVTVTANTIAIEQNRRHQNGFQKAKTIGESSNKWTQPIANIRNNCRRQRHLETSAIFG